MTTPSARTAEATEIARFWVESSPLQWNRITRNVAAGKDYNYWRPVIAIQNADADGNPRTSGDPTWTPLVPPPTPDYDSAHAVEGGTAAQVLKRFFGTDYISLGEAGVAAQHGRLVVAGAAGR